MAQTDNLNYKLSTCDYGRGPCLDISHQICMHNSEMRVNPDFSPGLLQASCLSPYRASLRLFKIAPCDFVGTLGRAGKAA